MQAVVRAVFGMDAETLEPEALMEAFVQAEWVEKWRAGLIAQALSPKTNKE